MTENEKLLKEFNERNILLPLLKDIRDLKSILDQIQSDLADYQNERDIGMMDDNQWQQMFIDRMCANVTDYESLKLSI